jgi:uncharacterized protein YrzB (UPF0473 family)
MDNIITLTDDNGVEKQFQFIFAVNHEITKETFQFFVELNTNTPEVVAYKVGADGYLVDIESQEEWQFASDMFNAYMSQMRGGGCGGCHGGCGSDCGEGCDCDGDCGCEN